MPDGTMEQVSRLVPLFAGGEQSRARLGPGQIAELRRLDVERPSAPTFWAVVATELDAHLPPDGAVVARRAAERRWAVALRALAVLAGLYRKGHRLGAALAAAGFSEMRFQRLLASPEDRLPDEIATVARYLAAKGEAFDWFDLVRLAVEVDPTAADDARRDIARDYFRTQAKAKAASTADERS